MAAIAMRTYKDIALYVRVGSPISRTGARL